MCLREKDLVQWRSWMRGCLSLVSFAVLVNANTKGWVKTTICFKTRRNKTRVSHLQFVDDTIFFFRVSLVDLQNLKLILLVFRFDKKILLVFRHLSDLMINLNKNTLFGINISQEQISRLASMLECAVSG